MSDQTPSADLNQTTWLGESFDDYVIEKLIGHGGMAAVFKARDVKLDRPVAIKILPAAALASEELIKRFEREARVVAQISHANVAQVFRIGQVRGRPYYAMEFIDGVSLAQLLKEKGKLGPLQCIEFVTQAARGLRAAAQQGVIHRDVKPANIMLTREGVVKIVDFGIAKAVKDETFLTQAGAIVGTPRYMSPEQGKGLPVDHRTDIYSLGATCYHLVAGVPPFDSDNPVTLMLKHMQEPVRSITQFNDHVPYRLCNIIYGMMAKKVEDRITDYDELIGALSRVFQETEEEEAPVGAPGWIPEPEVPTAPTSRWKVIAVTAVLCMMLAVGVATSMSGSSEEKKPVATAEEPAVRSKPGDNVGLVGTVKTLHDLNEFSKEMKREREAVKDREKPE